MGVGRVALVGVRRVALMGVRRVAVAVRRRRGRLRALEVDVDEVAVGARMGARTDLERAAVHAMLIVQYTMRTMFGEAIATGQTLLGVLGVELPLDDLQARAPALLGGVAERMGARPIASLYDLADVTDPRVRMAQLALRHLTIAAFLANQALFPVVTAISVGLSLEHGNAPESALSYANYGLILGAFMGRYREGAEFGELGLRLCERFYPRAPTATVCLVVGFLFYANMVMRGEREYAIKAWTNPAVSITSTDHSIVMTPTGTASGDGLVFIPGAKVDPYAYLFKLSGIVETAGVTVVITKPTLNLAFFDTRTLAQFTTAAPEVLSRVRDFHAFSP